MEHGEHQFLHFADAVLLAIAASSKPGSAQSAAVTKIQAMSNTKKLAANKKAMATCAPGSLIKGKQNKK